MKICYLGHSSFVLTSSAGTSIVTDPYGEVGFCMPRVKADAVTVSHAHYDHCNIEGVDAPVAFTQAGEHVLGDIKLRGFLTDHDEAQGRKRGKNLVFKFLIDGLQVCHLGDLGEPFHKALADELRPVDILLLPVGGNYTIDAAQAKAYADALSPAVVIPMHYAVEGLTVDIAPPDEFLARYPEESVRYCKDGEIEFTREIAGAKTQVVLMNRR